MAYFYRSREAISESKEGYQYQTGVDKETSNVFLGPIGPDGKRLSKYHYDKVMSNYYPILILNNTSSRCSSTTHSHKQHILFNYISSLYYHIPS